MADAGGGIFKPGSKSRISGLDTVLMNLNREILKIKGRNRAGMAAVGLMIKGRSIQRAPERTGHLRGSFHQRSWDDTRGVGVTIYNTAAYAPHVHEIEREYRGGEWKFIENPIKESREEIFETLRKFATI